MADVLQTCNSVCDYQSFAPPTTDSERICDPLVRTGDYNSGDQLDPESLQERAEATVFGPRRHGRNSRWCSPQHAEYQMKIFSRSAYDTAITLSKLHSNQASYQTA